MIAACVLGAFVLSVVFTGLLMRAMSHTVNDQIRSQAQAIAREFQRRWNFTPEIRMSSTVLVAQNSPALELVTAERKAIVQHRWEQTWLGSTKNFDIEATFTAKAGFDLKQQIVVKLDDRNGATKIELPPPQIFLPLGMSAVRVRRDEDGLWNKLTAGDREAAFAALEAVARKEFEGSTLLAEAQLEIEKRLKEILKESLKVGSPSPSP